MASGDYDGASEALRTSLTLAPHILDTYGLVFPASLPAHHQNVVGSYARLAKALDECKRHEDAVEVVQTGLQLDAGVADLHTRMGASLLALNQTATALSSLETALQIDPDHPG
jgi:cytochrome c-type biogenesis protein CcmH/NrfG